MGFLNSIFNEEKRIMKQYEKKANEIEKNSSENFSEQSPVQCSDGDLAPSRKFNKEMQWRLGVGGILTISGEGEINDQVKKEQLWKNYNSKIKICCKQNFIMCIK